MPDKDSDVGCAPAASEPSTILHPSAAPSWACVRCTEDCGMIDSEPVTAGKPFGKRKCKPCIRSDRNLQRWFKNGHADQKKWLAKKEEDKALRPI